MNDQMLELTSPLNVANGLLADAKSLGDYLLQFSFEDKGFYLYGLLSVQLSVATELHGPVEIVFRKSPEEKMVRVNASSIVASMKHAHSGRNFSSVERVGQPVRSPSESLVCDSAVVPFLVPNRRIPAPAFIRSKPRELGFKIRDSRSFWHDGYCTGTTGT